MLMLPAASAAATILYAPFQSDSVSITKPSKMIAVVSSVSQKALRLSS
jgi:hypothetical protein